MLAFPITCSNSHRPTTTEREIAGCSASESTALEAGASFEGADAPSNFSYHHGAVPPANKATTTPTAICDVTLGFCFSVSASCDTAAILPGALQAVDRTQSKR